MSGAASAQEDDELAMAGLAAVANPISAAADAKVSYFASKDVTAAFGKGAVLLDASDGRNYMVHASRREKAGMAEVHTLDTDVIYVLGGSATLVTGGPWSRGRPSSPTRSVGHRSRAATRGN